MNKQQTIELLKQQLPGFYSVEQVINIINDVDTGSSGLSEEKLTEISESIYDVVEKKMREVDASDVVDFSSAEFSIEYDNRVVLEAIEKGKLQNLIFDNQAHFKHRALASILGAILKLPGIKQVMASEQVKSKYILKLIENKNQKIVNSHILKD